MHGTLPTFYLFCQYPTQPSQTKGEWGKGFLSIISIQFNSIQKNFIQKLQYYFRVHIAHYNTLGYYTYHILQFTFIYRYLQRIQGYLAGLPLSSTCTSSGWLAGMLWSAILAINHLKFTVFSGSLLLTRSCSLLLSAVQLYAVHCYTDSPAARCSALSLLSLTQLLAARAAARDCFSPLSCSAALRPFCHFSRTFFALYAYLL
jgi:hypothetical protein